MYNPVWRGSTMLTGGQTKGVAWTLVATITNQNDVTVIIHFLYPPAEIICLGFILDLTEHRRGKPIRVNPRVFWDSGKH
jgi:hypothetical protein